MRRGATPFSGWCARARSTPTRRRYAPASTSGTGAWRSSKCSFSRTEAFVAGDAVHARRHRQRTVGQPLVHVADRAPRVPGRRRVLRTPRRAPGFPATSAQRSAVSAMRAPRLLAFAGRMLRRDARAGELRLLVAALIVAVAAFTAVGFFIDLRAPGARTRGQPVARRRPAAQRRPCVAGQRSRHSARVAGLAVAQTQTFPSMVGIGSGDALRAQLAEVKAVSTATPAARCAWRMPRTSRMRSRATSWRWKRLDGRTAGLRASRRGRRHDRARTRRCASLRSSRRSPTVCQFLSASRRAC